MSFSTILFLLLGAVIGFFYVIYVVVTPKDKHAVLPSFVTLTTISIPLIISNFSGETTEIYLQQITFGLVISIILVMLSIYLFVHRRKQKQILRIYNMAIAFSFLNLLIKGYYAYEEEVQDAIKVAEVNRQRILDNLGISEFIAKMFIAREKYRDDDTTKINNNRRAFATYVMSEFLITFIGRNVARFSLREYDSKSNSMKCTVTTEKRRRSPKNIPLNKRNMILQSAKKQAPIFYSNNKQFHFETNGSIKNGEYDDDITYCIICPKNNPRMSICFDFKNDIKEKMHAFVQSGYFKFICDLINFDVGVKL